LVGVVALAPPDENLLPSRLPNALAYPTHAALGGVFRILSPSRSANQWLKAASHARSPDDVRRAGDGIAAALRRSPPLDHLDLDVCTVAAQGSPGVQAAVRQAGLACPSDLWDRHHEPDGTPIRYQTRPPVAGPHYPTPYVPYGVVEQPILPGTWVHNLEHGAVVLLYNCHQGCPELVDQIRALVARLPPNRNNPDGTARLLAVPYTEMDHRLAVIAWGHLRELDQLDEGRIADFYLTYVDRGPECRAGVCPP
jgi:hypothetical protein